MFFPRLKIFTTFIAVFSLYPYHFVKLLIQSIFADSKPIHLNSNTPKRIGLKAHPHPHRKNSLWSSKTTTGNYKKAEKNLQITDQNKSRTHEETRNSSGILSRPRMSAWITSTQTGARQAEPPVISASIFHR